MFTNLSTINDVSIRILSIDPGTNRLGIAFSIGCFKSRQLMVEEALTFDIDRLVNVTNEHMVETHGKYNTMSLCVYNLVKDLVQNYQPDWVICESPYMNSRFPLPYALLTLCTQSIQMAVKDYDVSIGFSLIDPASVKKRIGAKGNSGDKDSVYKAVSINPNINVNPLLLETIDEHASDAIAIGYYGFSTYLIDFNLMNERKLK